jgi:hypothetical protein
MRRQRGAGPIKITGTNTLIHQYGTIAQHDERSNNEMSLLTQHHDNNLISEKQHNNNNNNNAIKFFV